MASTGARNGASTRFKKGYDPRRNNKGRPSSFDTLRKMAQAIGDEPAVRADGSPVMLDGRVLTITEVILRRWAASANPQAQEKFLQVAYGKVPDAVVETDPDGNAVDRRPILEVHFPNAAGAIDGQARRDDASSG